MQTWTLSNISTHLVNTKFFFLNTKFLWADHTSDIQNAMFKYVFLINSNLKYLETLTLLDKIGIFKICSISRY